MINKFTSLVGVTLSLVALLTACGPSVDTRVQQTLSAIQSVTLEPTLAPTRIQLSDIDLKTLLRGTSDELPVGYLFSEFEDRAPQMLSGIVSPKKVTTGNLMTQGDRGGFVTILLYDDISKANTAFKYITDGFGSNSNIYEGDYGDIGVVTLDLGIPGTIISIDMVMQYCNTVYFTRFTDSKDQYSVQKYLYDLIDTVSPMVCE